MKAPPSTASAPLASRVGRNGSVGYNRTSHVQLGNIEYQEFINISQMDYPSWWTWERLVGWLRLMPEHTAWNCFICLAVLLAITLDVIDFTKSPAEKDMVVVDLVYNVLYGVHVAAIIYDALVTMQHENVNWPMIIRFLIDFVTYLHYVIVLGNSRIFKIVCYYLRLHRPFKYLWELNDYNLKGSILGTTLKYIYIFFVLRITWALVWVNMDKLEMLLGFNKERRALNQIQIEQYSVGNWSTWYENSTASMFLNAVYIVNKMFIPIGLSVAPANDIERVACMLVVLTGCLMVTGAAVASLSLVISIYMRPEEAFRERYRLIMKIMKESKIPPSLREKVETFYRMYWHKQRAVSATELLPTYPPTLPAAIYTDIYFEATQKSRILCDLSYQFLSEISKKMSTIYYIPGDTIIKRTSRKSSFIFISSGDIEMLSAEDDVTAVVRMTRGTAVSGCAGAPAAACARALTAIRAATFCIAHALPAPDLWRVALKHAKNTDQAHVLLSSFYEHLERVKKHYYQKIPEEVKYKSSILHFKRNLMSLKESRDAEGKLLLDRSDVFLEIAGCYIMRNRADGSQTDDADAICLRSTFPCILQPASSLQHAWTVFICCVIFTVAFTHPYYLIFKKSVPVEFRFYDYVVTLIYTLDLIVHLSTGKNVEEGVPITFLQTSSQQMRSQWFIMAVAGTLPIFEFIGNGHFAGINKLLQLPKVFCALKSLEEVCVYHSNVLRFLSYTLVFLVACYLVAALQQGFMCYQFTYCIVTNFTHPPFWNKSKLDEATVDHRLTFSLYWAISMITFTSHMESWSKTQWDSALYTLFVLEMCVVFQIFIEAVYSATIMVTTALREDYDNCIAHVKDFLIRNEVDSLLRQRFITYLQLCWYTDKAYSMTNKTSIFHDLPPHVYQDIVTRQRSKYLLSIPFMKLLNKEDLKDVSSQAKLFYTSPNEVLLNTGDISNEMYLIRQGFCEMVNPDTKEVMGSLGVKSHFGVLECLLRVPAYYTVRAVTHVQVFSISKKVLIKVMEIPQVKDAIDFAKEQPEYDRLSVRRESFLHYEPPARAGNSERFRLPRKHESDTGFLEPFERLGFFSIFRYIFPRFSIRPDGRYIVRYEWFRAVCALLSATLFPCYTYLVLQWSWLYFVALLLDFAAYFDIVQRMLVGYYNKDGMLVYHPVSAAAHYIKGAFVADIFACLPLEYLQSPHKETYRKSSKQSVDILFSSIAEHIYFRVHFCRQLLMLNRLLQLYRLPGAMYTLAEHIERRDILLVLKAIPLFMALLNALTCFMIFNSVDIYTSEVGDSWLIVPLPDDGGSWIHHFIRFNLTETPWNLHLATYFWVVYETTTTGYSCFNPSNFRLMEILFAGMVIGAMITTYFSVRIISIRANVNKELAEYQEDLKDIAAFMRRENLDKNLQNEVRDYYEYNWEKMGGVDYAKVLKLCDQITLRTDATLHLYGSTFAQCPFLANCDISLLRVIGRAVRNMYFLRGTLLIKEDDIMTNMYFVDQGTVNIRMTFEELNLSQVVRLQRGSVFGNLGDLATVRSPVTIVATSKVHLLQINSMAFQVTIAEFPHILEIMQTHRPNEESYIKGIQTTQLKDGPIGPNVFKRRGLIKYLYFKDKFLQIYLIIVSLACVYADLYNAGFQVNNMLLIMILYGLDVGFYLKILMQYILPLLSNSISMKEMLLTVRKSYFQNDFKYDVISCLPLELLSLACRKYRWMAFSLLRLNRMLRIVTVYKCLWKDSSRITVNLTLSTVFSVFVWFTLFVHSVACFWYFLSLIEDDIKPGTSWRHKDQGGTWCQNTYICSLYFVLTTFTQNGVGDIMPKNQAEVVFVSMLQIISTLMYMVYVGEFSNIIQYQSFRSFSFYSRYLELQEFLKNNRVSKNLVNLVNRYGLHLWRESRGLQVPHFLTTAPQCLKLKVMSAAYIHHLNKNSVFEECEPAFLRQLVGCLRLFTYNKGMYVVKEGEITDAMYFIHSGYVLETSARTGDGRTYLPTEGFGVENGLIYDSPFQRSYRTLGKCQVLTLNLVDWEHLMEHFPKSRTIMYRNISRDDDYPQKPHVRVQSHSMEGRWSDFIDPRGSMPVPPKDRVSRQGRPSSDKLHSKRGRSAASSNPPPPPSPSPSPPPPPPLSPTLSPPPNQLKKDVPNPIGKVTPDPNSLSLPLSGKDIPATAATDTKPPAIMTSPIETQEEGAETQRADNEIDLTSYIRTAISSVVQGVLRMILPSSDVIDTELTAPISDTPGPEVASTEPIVAQPYSAHSLKITELPPSATKTKSLTSLTSTIDLNRQPGPEFFSVPLVIDPQPSTRAPTSADGSSDVAEPSKQQPERLSDLADLTERNEFINADLLSDNYPFIWPMNNKKSESEEIATEKDQLNQSSKSIRSTQSQQSLEKRRELTDIDEGVEDSATLMDKMESRARKLFRRRQEQDEINLQTEESSDKDILLLEEDEATTSALLHKLKRHDRPTRAPADLEKMLETTKPSVPTIPNTDAAEKSQSLKWEGSESKRSKTSTVRIQEPSEEMALVPYNQKDSKSSTRFEGPTEEPTSTSRLKRTIRDAVDRQDRRDALSVRSLETGEEVTSLRSALSSRLVRSEQNIKNDTQSVRSLRINDSEPSVHSTLDMEEKDAELPSEDKRPEENKDEPAKDKDTKNPEKKDTTQ